MVVKDHWERIYSEKSDLEVSWFQNVPQTSLKLIDELQIKAADPIIDIGGGNSNLAFNLLDHGYSNVSVLDISGVCIQNMKDKHPELADQIQWIESDINNFRTDQRYKVWHDRAVFHFFASISDKQKYKKSLMHSLEKDGYFILSTFSVDGPERCSGLEVVQYDVATIKSIFGDSFDLMNVFNEDHITPTGNPQNFIFSVWKKLK